MEKPRVDADQGHLDCPTLRLALVSVEAAQDRGHDRKRWPGHVIHEVPPHRSDVYRPGRVAHGLAGSGDVRGGDVPLTDYISATRYDQHNPMVADGLKGLGSFLGELASRNESMTYRALHKIVAEGTSSSPSAKWSLQGLRWRSSTSGASKTD